MQRRRVGIALRDGEKLNKRAHSCSRFALRRADANVAFITRSAPPTGRRLQFCGEIENAKPVAVISPHSNKLKSCLAGESDKALRRVFVGIFSDDLLARMEMKLPVFYSHSLIDFADETDLDPAFVRIVNRVVPPMSKIEVRVELAVRAREQI